MRRCGFTVSNEFSNIAEIFDRDAELAQLSVRCVHEEAIAVAVKTIGKTGDRQAQAVGAVAVVCEDV